METQDYINQARNFLFKTNTTLKITLKTNAPYFEEDKQTNTSRDVYNCTLRRGERRYFFTFGNSLHDTQLNRKPDEYDVLSCFEKYYPESFEDFCSTYGFETDSKSAERIYNACREQYLHLCSLYSEEEMKMLKDIQ